MTVRTQFEAAITRIAVARKAAPQLLALTWLPNSKYSGLARHPRAHLHTVAQRAALHYLGLRPGRAILDWRSVCVQAQVFRAQQGRRAASQHSRAWNGLAAPGHAAYAVQLQAIHSPQELEVRPESAIAFRENPSPEAWKSGDYSGWRLAPSSRVRGVQGGPRAMAAARANPAHNLDRQPQSHRP